MNPDTITRFIDDLAQRAGDDLAIDYEGRELSFAELAARSRRVAAGLAGLGIGAGDRVAVWLPNVPAWLELLFACARLGAIALAVNTRFRASEVEDIVGRAGARVLVLWPGFKDIDFLGMLGEIDGAAMPALETVVLYGEDGGEGARADASVGGLRAVPYGDLAAAPPIQDAAAEPDAGCLIYTTSGTTSKPKFVCHGQAGLVRHARAVAPAFGYDADDAVLLQALPLCGAFGMSQALAGLAGGRPMVMMRSFEAGRAAELIREKRVTHMNGSDEMYLRMIEARPEARPFPSLRKCGFAAFNSDPGELVALGDERGLPLVGLFGMSEVQALFSARPVDAPADTRKRGGGVPASPEAEVRARDPHTGEILAHGERGEIELRGPSLMKEYFANPAASREAFTPDGFLKTGDLGYTEEGGGFTFLARMGDVLRLGGYLVAPDEIAAYLEAHEGVAAAQVVGLEGKRGTSAVAFVIPLAGVEFSESALSAYCAKGMARFKVPARIFALDEFPATQSANGVKIQRGKLREMAKSRIDAEG
ncbi:MAG: AMP-binding protein [Alphaproteobacteria bacterium]